MNSIAWLVQRSEMPLEGSGLDVFTEAVYLSEQKARNRCLELDPESKGFIYTCPCGCGDRHYRSWDLECVVFNGEF